MLIDERLLLESIDLLAGVRGVFMDYESLAEDVALLARSWPDASEFQLAVANTVRALEGVVAGIGTPAPLKYDLEGWNSCHYQHRVAQGQRADMRLVFQRRDDGIYVKGFGCRDIPIDFYERMANDRA